MGNSDRSAAFLHMLSARSAGTEYLYFYIFRLDSHIYIALSFRNYLHQGKRGMTGMVGIKRR